MAENDTETETPAEGIWDDDHLERWREANFLHRFLVQRLEKPSIKNQKKSYVLNLDTKWGGGKTFFLERFKLHLEEHGYLVAYINAWEDDHAADPLIPIISSIDKTLRPLLKKAGQKKKLDRIQIAALSIAATTAKEIAIGITNKTTGIDVRNIVDVSKNVIQETAGENEETLLDQHATELLTVFEKGKKSIAEFKSQIASLLNELLLRSEKEADKHKLPFFILIDELDRCRPPYAIETLERVKHLFEVDNIIFVLATDSSQLRHSIKAVYGNDFDAGNYLSRFFDRRYSFKKPDPSRYVEHLYKLRDIDESKFSSPFQNYVQKGENPHLSFLQCTFRAFHLELRDIEQCFELFENVVAVWPYKAKIELLVMIPIIIAYHRKDSSNDFFEFSALRFPEEMFEKIDWYFEYDLPEFKRFASRSYTQKEKINLSSLMKDVTVGWTKSLHDIIYQGDPSNHKQYWIKQVFQSESHEEQYNISSVSDIRSIIDTYPELISSSGQLAKFETDESPSPHK